MDVLGFVVAVFVMQPLILGLGLGGYWLRPRRPGVGLTLGILGVALAIASLLITDLRPFQVASVAGLLTGVAAALPLRARPASKWLAVGAAAVWCLSMAWLLVDAS